MATLTVNGNTIPLAADGGLSGPTPEEIGERTRAFDGSMLQSIRARKNRIVCRTPLVSRATAETYRGWLLATPPLTVNGDALNNVAGSYFAQIEGLTAVPTVAGLKWRLAFTLLEA
jgi:hypothetical protein